MTAAGVLPAAAAAPRLQTHPLSPVSASAAVAGPGREPAATPVPVAVLTAGPGAAAEPGVAPGPDTTMLPVPVAGSAPEPDAAPVPGPVAAAGRGQTPAPALEPERQPARLPAAIGDCRARPLCRNPRAGRGMIEIEGVSRPGMVAEWLGVLMPDSKH